MKKRTVGLVSALAIIIVSAVLFPFIPRPELLYSIAVRFISSGIAIYLAIRFREWRLLFLAVMFFLMADRQILTFLIWIGVIETNSLSRMLSEAPGFVVTGLTLVSIIYIGIILLQGRKIIETQKQDIDALKGLLPICANCKKIRDDRGYWNQLESYIELHSDAQFSHGLCEECAEKLYGDKKWFKERKEKD